LGVVMVGTSLWLKHNQDLARRGGGLVVTTDPEGASLTLDGTSIGTSPYSAQGLPTGDHGLEIQLEGYGLKRQVLKILPDEVTIVDIALSPKKNSGGL